MATLSFPLLCRHGWRHSCSARQECRLTFRGYAKCRVITAARLSLYIRSNDTTSLLLPEVRQFGRKRPTGSGAAYPLLVDVLGASNKPAGATDGDGILSSSFRLIPSLYLFLFLYFSFCLFNVFFLSYAFVFYVL